MPTINFSLSDTPAGGVAIKTDFTPAVGNPCSPAQAAALEIIRRTNREWGVDTLGKAGKGATATASTKGAPR